MSPDLLPTVAIGIDVAKRSLAPDATLLKVPPCLSNTPAAFKEVIGALRRLKGVRPHLIIEATGGYERPLVDALHQAGFTLSVVNPARVRHFANACGQTFGYSVYANRVYLADLREERFSQNEIFIARKALEACLINSALLALVMISGGGICARSGPGIASLRR